MLAYCFSAEGVFTGVETPQESPLEPGVFLMPAQSCAVAPPEIPASSQAVWNGEAWEVVPVPVPEEPETVVVDDLTQEQIAEMEAKQAAAIAELQALGLSDAAIAALFGVVP